jgi:hypothetical protein
MGWLVADPQVCGALTVEHGAGIIQEGSSLDHWQ